MDHLWFDHSLQQEPDVIPYYEPGTLEKLGAGDYTIVGRQIKLQQESFFGLLQQYHELWGLPFRREDYVTHRDGKAVLTTSRLHLLVEDVLNRRASSGDSNLEGLSLAKRVHKANSEGDRHRKDEELHQAIQELLSSHAAIINNLFESLWVLDMLKLVGKLGPLGAIGPLGASANDLPPLIACAILVESLTALSNFAFNGFAPDSIEVALDNPFELLSYWKARGLRNGHCARRIHNAMAGDCQFSQAYVATSILGLGDRDHGACDFVRLCQAPQRAVSLPSHAGECGGNCELMCLSIIDVVHLEEGIRRQGFGLLEFCSKDMQDPTFGVRSSTSRTAYVAFSHVWTHGMGNPTANGLPACQLLTLKRTMQRAGCLDFAFWIDPICVPLKSELTRPAVAAMNKVYAQATVVIVIDRDMVRCAGNSALKRQVVAMSDWITRLWTLQEAILPGNRLYIAFADQIRSMDSLYNDIRCDDEAHARSLLMGGFQTSYLRTALCRHGLSAIDLIQTFHTRNLTNASDEGTCLAILLDADFAKLPALPTIHDVLASLPEVEQNIIYAEGPRSERPGFRWCTASFMLSNHDKLYDVSPQPTILGPGGIRMQKDIILLGSISFSGLSGPHWYSLPEQEITLEFPAASGISPRVMYCYTSFAAGADEYKPRDLVAAALVLEKALERADGDTTSTSAILVSGLREEAGELYAHYECKMTVADVDYRERKFTLPWHIIKMPATSRLDARIWVD